MNDGDTGKQECALARRPVPFQLAPFRVRVTPRLRTAMRAAWVGDRRSAPSRRGAAVGSPFPRRAHRSLARMGLSA
jgi:hypothetical protein